jgi:hypothetical protein
MKLAAEWKAWLYIGDSFSVLPGGEINENLMGEGR